MNRTSSALFCMYELDTYRERKEESRYSRRVGMAEIRKNEMNLNISRYVRTAEA